jgi:hypothetical protein
MGLYLIYMNFLNKIFYFRIQMKQSQSPSQFEHIKCSVNGSIIRSTDFSSILQNMCPLTVIFLQFSITSMFMWMLCEGIHLNNVLTVSVFKNHFKTCYFYILGWGKKIGLFFFCYCL